MRSDRKLSALVLACALGGCLPPGEPPTGQHIVHDRTLSGVSFSPSEQEGVPSYLLATGPLQNPGLDEPYADTTVAAVYRFADGIPVATVEGLAGVEPTIESMVTMLPTVQTFATDIRGRLLFPKLDLADRDAAEDPFRLWRLDLATGQGESLGDVDIRQGVLPAGGLGLPWRVLFLQSPGRAQVFTGRSGRGTLIGLDSSQSLWQASAPAFIGEDFYCAGIASGDPGVASGTNIIRVRPGAEPETLYSSTGSLGLFVVAGDVVPQLILSLKSDTSTWPLTQLDTETLESRSIPIGEFVSASPNGRLLLFRNPLPPMGTQPTQYNLFIFDWTTGHYAVLDVSRVGKGMRGDCEWRPGTSDLWCSTLPDGLVIWSPTREMALLDAELFAFGLVTRTPVFTADGRHWFSQAGGPRPTIYVGSADDPYAARVPLNPQGTQTGRYWLLPDGRLLVGAWASDPAREDIYLVDADAGTSRALGNAGRLVAAGQTRALALLNVQVSRSTGELTLIDYESGSRQVLAPDVYAVAVDPGTYASVPPGTDPLAPGTRVAFLSRNRLASRDDGLWVTELP